MAELHILRSTEESIQAMAKFIVTLVINSANLIAFLDTDESKAEVLRAVLEPAPGEEPLPASMVHPINGDLHWFLTKGAAKLLRVASSR